VSSLISSTPAVESAPPHAPIEPRRRKRVFRSALILIGCILACWGGVLLYRNSVSGSQGEVPVVKVERGDISLSIFARGEVRGGNSQVLTAPMTGGSELHILSLTPNGAPVNPGDIVVQFDTTDQEYALREAQSDVAEAEQHIQQATGQLLADGEEDRYALSKARTDLQLAELEARKDPLLPSITAKQNDLAVAVAREKLSQLEENRSNKKVTDEAGIAVQQAARGKAEAKVITAKQNIQSMTLRAQRSGYVSVKQNTGTNFFFTGMELPVFQVGDQARPGMAVAEIPDLNHWEVAANIGELDRGHLAVGDKVNVSVIALPQRTFRGHVTDIGSSSGPPWDRRFECKVALDNQAPELRPGLSTRVEITTETIKDALWLPAQALFEADGKMFVYLRTGKTFERKDVTLVRRNETRVVLTGLRAGQQVALANPTQATTKQTKAGSSPLQAVPK
jgi:HlyD family secretion protein